MKLIKEHIDLSKLIIHRGCGPRWILFFLVWYIPLYVKHNQEKYQSLQLF